MRGRVTAALISLSLTGPFTPVACRKVFLCFARRQIARGIIIFLGGDSASGIRPGKDEDEQMAEGGKGEGQKQVAPGLP